MDALVLTIAIVASADHLIEELYWPAPTPQVTAHIKKLGDDDFVVREKSHNKLAETGWPALKALKKGLSHSDAEIARRCRSLLEEYFAVYPTEVEKGTSRLHKGIFKLDYGKKIKLHNGKSITLISKDEADEHYSQAWAATKGDSYIYHDDDVAAIATSRYVQELLRLGATRREVEGMLNSMEKKAPDLPQRFSQNYPYGGPR